VCVCAVCCVPCVLPYLGVLLLLLLLALQQLLQGKRLQRREGEHRGIAQVDKDKDASRGLEEQASRNRGLSSLLIPWHKEMERKGHSLLA